MIAMNPHLECVVHTDKEFINDKKGDIVAGLFMLCIPTDRAE